MRPYIQILQVTAQKLKLLYTDKAPHLQQKKFTYNANDLEGNVVRLVLRRPVPVIGDIIIRLFHNGK